MKASDFEESPDPLIADEWLAQIQVIIELYKCVRCRQGDMRVFRAKEGSTLLVGDSSNKKRR